MRFLRQKTVTDGAYMLYLNMYCQNQINEAEIMKKRLSREEGLKLLKEYGTPEHVVRHCIAVTDTTCSYRKGSQQSRISPLDIELIQGACNNTRYSQSRG